MAGGYGRSSPPMSPGSPLTYSPQIPMEPIPKHDEVGRGGPYSHTEFAGWAAQPKLVPTVIVCESRCCVGAWPPRAGTPSAPFRAISPQH